MEKQTVNLDGRWQFKEYPETARRMRDLEQGQWMYTHVPSSVYMSLVEAGCLNRFDLEANPEDAEWVSQRSWVYRRQFELDSALSDCNEFEVVFEGLDTITQVWFNGKLLGKTENMFIAHRFSVTNHIRPGINTLMVKFQPAYVYAERLMQRYGKLSDHHYGDPRRTYMRKAQYQFGSVLGPALPGCGIFRSTRLQAWNTARLEDVHIRTIDCNQHYADVAVTLRIQRASDDDTVSLTAGLTLSGGAVNIKQALHFGPGETKNTTVIRIERPIFWQPNGYGVPHQYRLETHLYCRDDRQLDTRITPFGIRTVRLKRSHEANGESFRFEVNDTPVHIRGANWLPPSMFPGETKDEFYEHVLYQLKEAHINMLRVWGGGFYENDIFYELCDKLGILVWQDFAFVSAYYPDRQWFLDIVQTEAQAVIKRLRNHPSLALWCGNSRIDHLHQSGQLGEGRKFYGRHIYHKILPDVLSELDSDREFVPTTPFSEDGSNELNSPLEGTCHHWQVWNEFAPTCELLFEPSEMPRFLNEFGIRSLPNQDCLKRICPPHRLYCSSPAIEKHNYQADGSERLARYCAELFPPPKSLDEHIEQTQLAQARAAKLCVEHLRANSHINAGVLLWTANDCTPSPGFSAIDVSGRPKALYYYMRRFFSPIMVTLEIDKAAYLGAHVQGDGVVVINDTSSPLIATVRCQCMDFYGKTLDAIEFPVAIGPFSKSAPRKLPKALACPPLPNRNVLQLDVIADSKRLAENRFFYLPDKYIDWPAAAPEVSVKTRTPSCWTVCLVSNTLMRDVSVTPATPGGLSDNFFDLPPQKPVRIDISFPQEMPSTRIPLVLRSIPHGLI